MNKFKVGLVMIGLMLLNQGVMAQTLGTVADNIVDDNVFNSIFNFITAFCQYILGPFFLVKTFLQLKDHSHNPEQHKLSKALTSLVTGSFFLSLSTLMTVFADSAQIASDIGVLSGLLRGNAGDVTDGALSLGDAFANMAKSIPSIMRIVSLGAILAGFFFTVKAILLLPQLTEGRVPGHKVFWTFFAGAILYSLSPMISSVMSSIGAGDAEVGGLLTSKYYQTSGGDISGTVASVLIFVQLLGLIAFIRGALIMKAMGDDKDGTMGRALTFLLGGAAAMNISWTVSMLANTMGAKSVICGLASTLCSGF